MFITLVDLELLFESICACLSFHPSVLYIFIRVMLPNNLHGIWHIRFSFFWQILAYIQIYTAYIFPTCTFVSQSQRSNHEDTDIKIIPLDYTRASKQIVENGYVTSFGKLYPDSPKHTTHYLWHILQFVRMLLTIALLEKGEWIRFEFHTIVIHR